MSRKLSPLHVVLLVIGLTALLFAPKVVYPDAPFYQDVFPGPVRHALAAVVKLLGLLLGALFAFRVAGGLESSSAVRRAWTALGAGLGASFAGQLVFSYFVVIQGDSPPIPSVGDGLFMAGQVTLIVALTLFARAYVRSGLPLGSVASHLWFVGLLGGIFALGGAYFLAPIAEAEAPLGERLVNIGYPMLDLLALLPTLVLLRMTLRLYGGKVWTVWATIMAGLFLMSGGDVLYAYFSVNEVKAVIPLFDILFMDGYALVAAGIALQLGLQRTD